MEFCRSSIQGLLSILSFHFRFCFLGISFRVSWLSSICSLFCAIAFFLSRTLPFSAGYTLPHLIL